MELDLLSLLLYLARSTLSAWLFAIAGGILVVSRPRWRGSWLLLVGAILSSLIAGIRLLGFLPRDGNMWASLAFEAADTMGYVLAGLGILLVSMRLRTEGERPPDAPDVVLQR